MGQNTSYLRTYFGPPTEVIPNGEMGEIWLYERTYTKSTSGSAYRYGNVITWQSPQTYEYTAYKKFWVSNGNVFNWEAKGEQLRKVDPVATVFFLIGGLACGWYMGALMSW